MPNNNLAFAVQLSPLQAERTRRVKRLVEYPTSPRLCELQHYRAEKCPGKFLILGQDQVLPTNNEQHFNLLEQLQADFAEKSGPIGPFAPFAGRNISQLSDFGGHLVRLYSNLKSIGVALPGFVRLF